MRDALGSVQSVLVLGGSSEIAQATVRALVAQRARRIILAARDPAALDEMAWELEHDGVEVNLLAFDANDLDAHPDLVDHAFADGDIDLVLVAFGVLGDGESGGRDREAALEVLNTNFVGAVSVVLPVVERLRQQGHGTLVVLSSVAGERVRKSNVAYGASKAALDGFCQGLGDLLAGTGVRLMIVRPGFVHTRMTEGLKPAPLATTADKVAEVIVEGLRKDRDVVWVPPALRYVMAGLRHLPRPLFRRLPL